MSDPIECRYITYEQAKACYPALVRTYEFQIPKADKFEIARMVSIATSVCHYCWKSGRGCQCWNDE